LAEGVQFYLDENVQVVIADQLRLRGIEVVTARDLGALSDSDVSHLARATRMGYVLCTHDDDYLQLAASGTEHAGIVIGRQVKHTIGDWVSGLVLIHAVYSAEEMLNRVEYL
jgi:predicted nuclease of predicted toxin-antitoxin system